MLSRDIKPGKTYWCRIDGHWRRATIKRRSGRQWVVEHATYLYWLAPCQIKEFIELKDAHERKTR